MRDTSKEATCTTELPGFEQPYPWCIETPLESASTYRGVEQWLGNSATHQYRHKVKDCPMVQNQQAGKGR